MCGRYILVQKLEKIESRFSAEAEANIEYSPSYNISVGEKSLIICSDEPNKIKNAVFGMTPYWAKKPMYLFNARAEGDRNKEDSQNYRGAKEIIMKPAFRKPIRSQRCLVIADAFIEGTKDLGLDKAYVVFLRNKQRPFAFAGIYDDWTNPDTGNTMRSFAIITVAANDFIRRLPHHRCPVILNPSEEKKWLKKDLDLTDVTDLLKIPDSDIFNAYPISTNIKNPKLNYPDLIKPIGKTLIPESEIQITDILLKQGFGRNDKTF